MEIKINVTGYKMGKRRYLANLHKLKLENATCRVWVIRTETNYSTGKEYIILKEL